MAKAILLALLGVLAGIVTLVVVITGVEYVGHLLYPPPPGLDPTDPAQLSAIMAAQPVAAKAFVVLAWIAGAFLGGGVAALISRTWPRAAAVIVALCVVAGVCAMVIAMPEHPLWMSAIGLLLPVPAALFAAWPRARRKRIA
ncbi:hypothetical protein [Lysobacter fragariae]